MFLTTSVFSSTSSGGIVSVTTKSGTNEYHGDAWYLGRYPWANALDDRHYRTINLARQHTYGFDVGSPIRKNKLFNYFSFEQWKVSSPSGITASLPSTIVCAEAMLVAFFTSEVSTSVRFISRGWIKFCLKQS